MLYVAHGSHANYFFGPGSYPTSFERLGIRIKAGAVPLAGTFMDFATSFEDGVKVFPDVNVVPPQVDGRWTGDWRWLNFEGSWGSRRIWGTPASLRVRREWENPFRWFNDKCEEAPLPDLWLSKQ